MGLSFVLTHFCPPPESGELYAIAFPLVWIAPRIPVPASLDWQCIVGCLNPRGNRTRASREEGSQHTFAGDTPTPTPTILLSGGGGAAHRRTRCRPPPPGPPRRHRAPWGSAALTVRGRAPWAVARPGRLASGSALAIPSVNLTPPPTCLCLQTHQRIEEEWRCDILVDRKPQRGGIGVRRRFPQFTRGRGEAGSHL